MKDELHYIGNKIQENAREITLNIPNVQDAKHTKQLENSGFPLEERIAYREELIGYLGQALCDVKVEGKVDQWSMKIAKRAIHYDVPLAQCLRAIGAYRTAVWDTLTEELHKNNFYAITMLDVSKMIDPLIDRACSVTGSVYENHSNELMEVAYSALEELSVPVVPVAEGIAVIPLVGAVDTRRAALIMEVSLREGARLNLEEVILDVSGVPIIDTMVADQIFKIVSALKISGIHTVLTGLRPEIAQTIMSLGLDFNHIETKFNMRKALYDLGFRRQ
ncbi:MULTISPECIES: STAS domain-containing protein [Metabacillus]|uniref:Modulator protein n=1 Tax=Metabacillus indicus TaxID=246786 RepID=A0A084H2D9_METID|nr:MULTISPECIES: STAS domain-containing protein [Metabacillus]KEZ52540.1 modulator protein [Metabacillus indicus LMG 22858]KEZ53751.1 modulator protein [Metabacillus indicus]